MTVQSLRRSPTLSGSWETAAAHLLVFIVAIRYRFSPDIPIGFLVAGALIPVTLRYLPRHRGAVTISILAILSAISGLLLTLGNNSLGDVSGSLATVQTARVIGSALVLALLLWARSLLGIGRVTLMFGLGSLTSLLISGLNEDNVWKFSFSVPITLIVLSLPGVTHHRWRQMVVALVLVVVSALNDSRSAAGLLLIAVALTVTQSGALTSGNVVKGRAWLSLVRVALVGVGAFFIVQALILEGMLGEAARTRTEAQILQSGSSLVGGRPEMGAALSLITHHPWGYGAGTLASYDQIMLGKTGMKALGYDPNNGYVEQYMFGYGIEVHSLLGDLWILFGLAGATLAVAVVAFAFFGLGDLLSRGAATTVVIFLILRLSWDFAFSPIASALPLLPLTLAAALPVLSQFPARSRAIHPEQ